MDLNTHEAVCYSYTCCGVAYNHWQLSLGILRTQTKLGKAVSVAESLHCTTASQFWQLTSALIV